MTTIITVASLKGGSGKTTVALNLAVTAEKAGLPTVVIDVDPQQASAKWGDLRAIAGQAPTVISALAARLSQALRSAVQSGAKLVVIDTAAHAEGIAIAAIDVADLVLIPCRPTIIDLQYLTKTVQLSDLRKKHHAVILNAIQTRTIDRSQAEGAIGDMGINLTKASISNLVAYGRAITSGQGVAEFEPEGKAAAEVHGLFAEIMSMYRVDDSVTPGVGNAVFDWLKMAAWGRRRDSREASTPSPW